jgi:hypothetical protein
MLELYAPIERQILMTDTEEDVVLLASLMLTTSVDILVNRLGLEKTILMINQLEINRRQDGTSAQKPST